MSVRSMTGYGRGIALGGGLKVEVELSSVNRKQLDLAFNLPKSLAMLESRVQEELARNLSRGRITLDVAIHGSAAKRRESIRVDDDAAAAYLAAFRRTAKKLGLPVDISMRDLILLPGVLHADPVDDDVETVWPLLQAALRKALSGLMAMRSREGSRLAKDLLSRVAIMSGLLEQILTAAPSVVSRHREALRTRVRAIATESSIPDERLEREVILFADRCDITEETTRLASHIAQTRQMLRSKESAGKSLDFLAQEMNREINTIGSKANDAAIAQHVVIFKTELERFREQVQNIE